MELEVGKEAPTFSLDGSGGKTLDLAALRGQPVVVYFYPKDDTPGCTKEAIAFTGLKGDFEAEGAYIIGISPDTAAKHDKFTAKHDLKIDLASDPESEVATAYGVWVEKSMYGRKYMGVERSTFLIGADGILKKIWRKVKVPGHAETVLEAVKELKAG